MRLTPEKAVGIKFELWLRHYFRSLGYNDVKFNVEFHKSRYLYRQADLVITEPLKDSEGRSYIAKYLVEAKYSSNGPIRYEFRQGYKVKAGSNVLTNLVDEILERQNFVKSDGIYKSILVTNRYFDDRLIKEASRHDIQLMDGTGLFRDYQRLGAKYDSLERSINAIDLKRFDLKPEIVWIKR